MGSFEVVMAKAFSNTHWCLNDWIDISSLSNWMLAFDQAKSSISPCHKSGASAKPKKEGMNVPLLLAPPALQQPIGL